MKTVAALLFLSASIMAQTFTEGTLRRVDSSGRTLGDCPLKRTNITADIAGMLARVTVVQQFRNPYQETIEAVYGFPLPHDAGVDQMFMKVGDRNVKGVVKKREEARALYEAARQAGQTASLLNQERPNLFTQSVTNIPPGGTVDITISYVEVIKYNDGNYEFVFPMVVGPRYIPNNRVTDASRITPPVAPPGTRVGHDLSLSVNLDAGIQLGLVESSTHTIDVHRIGATKAQIKLRDEAVIPNKDFVLRYDGAGRTIESAVLTHRSARGGFFTLILQPPDRALAADISAKELVFVIDTSGSMMGFPVEKAKETIKLALDALRPSDTFNLITFSGDTEVLFPTPVAATPENLQIASLFLQSRSGQGGTEMMKAVRAALAGSGETGRVRIVCFMTDGYVGNDMDIIAEVQKHPEARVFGFGIGSSVNRFLLDRMSLEGRGEVEYVPLNENATAAVKRFEQRIREPLLTEIALDWGNLPVADIYPKRIPDLFSAKPVVVTGRYTSAGRGVIRLRGTSGGKTVIREVTIDLPASQPAHDSLATVWARHRVADLMRRDYSSVQRGTPPADLKNEITNMGLAFGLMTQFTSFIAVEERSVATGGRVRTVEVPVSIPEGVSHEGIFRTGGGIGSGSGGGSYPIRGGVVGGIIGSQPMPAPPPPPPSVLMLAPEATQGGVGSKLAPALRSLTRQASVVAVQILLRDATAATLASLRQAGLVVSRPVGRDLQVRGRIAGDKLVALAQLASVRYVVPVRR